MKRILRSAFPTFLWFIPLGAFANNIEIFTNPNKNLNFSSLANRFRDISNAVIPFLVGLSIVAIVWGIYKYIVSAGDAERVAEGRRVIVYGIVALFIMLGFWGLVMAINNTLFKP